MRLLLSLALACLSFVTVSAAGPLNPTRNDPLAITTYGTGVNLAIGGATSRYYNNIPFGATNLTFVNNGQPLFNGWLMTNEPQLSADLGFPAVWGLPEQLAYIRERHTEVAFASDTLYVLWIGGNDIFMQLKYFFNSNVSPYTGLIDTLLNETRSLLEEFEARTIIIPTLPDVVNTPYGQSFFSNEVQSSLNQALIDGNNRLRAELTALDTEFINSNILILDNEQLFPTIITQFTHQQTEACSTQVDLFNTTTNSTIPFQSCNDTQNWYFWDEICFGWTCICPNCVGSLF